MPWSHPALTPAAGTSPAHTHCQRQPHLHPQPALEPQLSPAAHAGPDHSAHQTFQLEDSQDCSRDFVEIREENATGHLLGRYCGNTLPLNYSSIVAQSLWIRFVSDGSGSGTGFQATFAKSWPQNYGNSADCVWLIQAPDSTVELNILSLDIESHGTCNYDKLVIRDGDNNMAQQLAVLCGREIPGPIRSTGEYMWLRFTSDFSVTRAGFNASFHKRNLLGRYCGSILPDSVDTSSNVALVRFVTDDSLTASGFRIRFESSLEACGGDLQGPTGTFTSPNYPNPNPHGRICEWRITVQEGKQVTLIVNNLRLEAHPSCNSERVTVFNGIRSNSPVLEKLCSSVNISDEIKSSGNTMKVIYFTDGSRPYGGFSASYTSSEDADNGTIRSPHWPQNFPENSRCSWTVITHESNHLEISFDNNFLIPSGDGQCHYSFVKVWAGTEETDKALLATSCGNVAPGAIITPRNAFTAVFQSQEAPAPGFSASFVSRK
ncbi:hypothetical protein QTO34_008050 [Cnephaeus nilssonii]|uniref:CUB domain-containing protein n=1 Tax=Cnephaeus nilssonii TaxID=3371016 RepID=A0AA40I9N5_CNENI|nr:hypothetical protein QTO34_008050 [Eptesicus nilssonii]